MILRILDAIAAAMVIIPMLTVIANIGKERRPLRGADGVATLVFWLPVAALLIMEAVR